MAADSTDTSLSIVIPAYNEAARIARGLEQVVDYLQHCACNGELIAVDDGSSDDTTKIVQEVVMGRVPLRVLRNPTNYGKGYSVKRGMLEAIG